ncbi:MAG TPA: hypothetical protein VMT99_00590 [Candidatus Paceibacterota bacterium]|nr:hypothetical protein [Candidatus Paceibacterota bacterium]
MFYIMVSLVSAFVGALPLLFKRKINAAIVQGLITAIVGYCLIYLLAPSTAYPLLGAPGLLTVIWWVFAAVIDGSQENEVTALVVVPIFGIILYAVVGLSGWEAFRASDYANMMGSVDVREWTQDVQPKDPAHMRMSTKENALYQAKKVMGKDGAIGSQFEISEDNMTLQMIRGELWYVVPLDYSGFGVWMNSRGVPGYIKVHAEDPHREPELVILKDDELMHYTPGAYFGNDLERHLRNRGYLNKLLSDWTFEVDEDGHDWWVVTVSEPTIAWWGERVSGVAIVNPSTGDDTFYPLGKVPDWVDRVIPQHIVKDYLAWQGDLSGGWWNSWWGAVNLTEPETPNLIYGSGDQPEWVTGITSSNGKDDSLVALVYTNSRTGKSVRYVMKGGGTDTAILDAVNKNSQVQFKHLHGVAPQIYNVYGQPTSVIPLFNESHSYQGVAMVPINDIQTVAVGGDQYEALRSYEQLLSEAGQRVALDKERTLQTIEGVVDRFSAEVTSSGGTVYYLHLPGISCLFTAGAGASAKLPVTKEGDKVKIEFYASDRDVVPIHGFDNLSLVLSASKVQQQVRAEVKERQGTQEVRSDTQTVVNRIQQMSPEDLQKLKSQVPPQSQ